MSPTTWPEGKRFAFTIFDDPDSQSLAQSNTVYSFLRDLGFLTTIGVWMIEPPVRNSAGETCEQPEYRHHVQTLVSQGFEAGFHSGAPGNLTRPEVIRSLDLYRATFGSNPVAMANHYNTDAMYWGNSRLTGLRRIAYQIVTRGGNSQFHGSTPEHESFWGDICRDRVTYCRNFITRDIDTLAAFPAMPYFDPAKPYVRAWYSSSEGANFQSFVRCVHERDQDRLEEHGGACIMYAHFGHGFVREDGRLEPRFVQLMERLAKKGGWFVPVSTLLGHLQGRNGIRELSPRERARMEWRWLASKLRHGTS